MKYDIYDDPVYRFEVLEHSAWKAVQSWMHEGIDLETFMDCKVVFHVSDEEGNVIDFTIDKSMGEFVAKRTDGKHWEPLDPSDLLCHGVDELGSMPNQTFNLGVSCYGPSKDGKFRGVISVESTTIHSKSYNTLDEARQESLGKLLESITVTLGFSRKEAIERLEARCRQEILSDTKDGLSID